MNIIAGIFLVSGLTVGAASALIADTNEACISAMVQATAWKPQILEGQLVAMYELEIANNTSIDISGIIVEHELWADARPIALATGYSQSAHLLGGGLLAGETTKFPEYIPLSAHAAKLAEAASEISIRVEVQNIADLQAHPVGTQPDPFALWSAVRSEIPCTRFRSLD